MSSRYIEVATGAVLRIRQIRQAHPNMSIPDNADLDALGYAKIEPAGAKPDITDDQIIRQSTDPEEYEPGKWRWTWVVEDKPVPQSVTALQGLLALDAAGLSGQYEAWAKDPARTFAERAFIDRAQHWERNDQTLVAAATALGLGDAQIDALFETAAQL